MPKDLWGPINITEWSSVPCTLRRAATEEDVKAGRAVFFCSADRGVASEPVDLPLPSCALQRIEGAEHPEPVVVIQLERTASGAVIAGVRYLRGGNGVCTFGELTLLPGPDPHFNGSAPA
jgi:hypothetical protein